MIADENGLFYLMLVDEEGMKNAPPIMPLWIGTCRTEETRVALLHWMSVRRHLWQNWVLLGQTAGPLALAQDIDARMAAERPGIRQATVVNRLEDERQVEFGTCLDTADGLRIESVYVHSFQTSDQRDHFFAWFEKGRNYLKAERLADLAVMKGTHALGMKLDAIAARHARSRPATRSDRHLRTKA